MNFIIGGTGFVGTRLCDRLKKFGIDFKIFDLKIGDTHKSQTIQGNICDVSALDAISNATVLINLAAVHRDDVRPLSLYDDVNIGGAKTLCNAARKFNINKIIFTSSVAIYGFAPAETDESGAPNYFNDYGRTKYLAEEVYKEWQAEDPDKRTLVIIRPTVIFGEGNRGNVYNLLRQIMVRRFVMFGSGKNKKSMAYVENVAAFIMHSVSFLPGLHIHNYIDKPDLDMNTLVSEARSTLFDKKNVGFRLPAFLGIGIGYIADIISKIMNKRLTVSTIRVKKFMSTTQFSSSVNDSGFMPPVSLEEGMERTLRYEFLEDNSDKRTFETE